MAAWLGWRPAAVTLVLGFLTADYFFVPPRDSFTLARSADLIEFFNYFIVNGTTVALIESLHRAARRSKSAAGVASKALSDLKEDMAKREQAEQALRETQAELARTNDSLERTVEERTGKLREAVEELERFSYSLIHDLRAPLRAMSGSADLLAEGLCESCRKAPNLSLIERIKKSAARLDRLITDLLNYERLAKGPCPLHEVDLAGFLRGLIETYPNLQPHTARIEVPDHLPTVLANEAALAQCFGNLLGNAVKFVAPGALPEIRIWTENRGGFVRVWVEDKGIGIPQAFLPRAFDMFQRAVRGYEGTGIGLAIVRKAAQRLGGQAGVESELGKGSRFWIELQTAPLKR